MDKRSKIYVAGHRGLVGSALMRTLAAEGFERIVSRTHGELDLTDPIAVDHFFREERPEILFLAAAKVGGILANSSYPADFIRINLAIQTHVIDAAHRYGVKRLIFLGSSCIYPKHCPQPMREEHLLTGPLEKTNDAYAVAKIAGITQCRAYHQQHGSQFLSVMPTNLYGPGDNFDLKSSHVLPALLRKVWEAKRRGDSSFVIWGSGSPRREFLFVDDMAAACLFLARLDEERYQRLLNDPIAPGLINIGFGEDLTIEALAEQICELIGFEGQIEKDSSKPDGTPRKLLDSSRLFALGWRPRYPLSEGLRITLDAYLANPPADALI